MRPLSLAALCGALALTLHASAQAPARAAQTRPRTPAVQTPAPTAQAATPRREAAVPFRVGEVLTYDVAWSSYLVAGSAVSRVVEKRPSYGSTAYYIVAEGRPLPLISRLYALYYKMDSLVDSFTLLTQRTSVYMEEGARKRSLSTLFNRASGRAQFEMQGDPPVKSDFAVPQNAQDGLSALYALRTRAYKAGERFAIPVADEGMLYTANFEVSGPEPIKVPFGQVDAWNLRITIVDAASQPVGRNIAAWISTDARHLPVKLQAELPVGAFGLALRTVE
jgi:hypothetical protein